MDTALIHYTRTIEIVCSILTKGFLLIPNPRRLMAAFLDNDAIANNEPQNFGMVCFTQLSIMQAEAHRGRFGPFGIAVSLEWAQRMAPNA